MAIITIKAKEKILSERRVVALTGISLEEVRSLARTRRLGYLSFDSAGGERVYSASDLAVLAFLHTRATRHG